MRDPRIFRLKLLIEADSKISHGARTLALRVCSHVHNDPHIMPEEPFPLPWTLASFLCWGMSRRECYRNLAELVKHNHMSYEGVKGCPGFAHYKLNFLAVTDNSRAVSKDGPRAVSKDGPRAVSKDGPRAVSKDGPRAVSKDGPRAVTVARPSTVKRDSPRASKEECPRTVREECSHISTLPSEEMIKTNGRKSSSLRSEERGEDKSSLRSEERSGIKSSLRSQERTGDGKPAAPQMTSAERARCAKQVRELAAKLSS